MNRNETIDAVLAKLDYISTLLDEQNRHSERSTAMLAVIRNPSEARNGPIDGVLFAGTVTLNAAGVWTADYPLMYGRVGVRAAAFVTAYTAANRGTVPTDGVGVVTFSDPLYTEVPLVGQTLTLYGTPGAAVFVSVRVGARV